MLVTRETQLIHTLINLFDNVFKTKDWDNSSIPISGFSFCKFLVVPNDFMLLFCPPLGNNFRNLVLSEIISNCSHKLLVLKEYATTVIKN